VTTANKKSVQTLMSIEDGFLVIRIPLTVAETVDPVAEGAPAVLTPRQAEVFIGLRTGRTIAQVAEAIGIAPGTAKFHTFAMLKRLGIESLFQFRAEYGGQKKLRRTKALPPKQSDDKAFRAFARIEREDRTQDERSYEAAITFKR
jgi:DNA-binding NarL/FixJ family response regulator